MKKTPFLGVAYYPEHWEREQIDEDLDKMVEHGISCVRIAEFAWKTMEPTEGTFDFSLFREVVDKCRERGIMVIMGTPGATPPLWLSYKYPDVYGERMDGVKRFHGERQDCCYNHREYLNLALRITKKMAKEFSKDENVIGWQIDNEITATKDDGMFCVCPRCEAAFKKWVSNLYDGDVQKFNRELGLYVFSSAIDSFDELHRPYKQWYHPGYLALWRKFQLYSASEYVKEQYKAIKSYTDKPVGTDTMITLTEFSYEDAAKNTDIIQLNEYLRYDGCKQLEFWANFAYNAKKQPYWLTETSTCWNGGVRSVYMRQKGFINMNAWMNLANGAESINYWLWRTHYAGQELMHGSVIETSGRPRHIKNEVVELSKNMDKCATLINGTRPKGSGFGFMVSENSARTLEFQNMYMKFQYYPTMVLEFCALAAARLRPEAIMESTDLKDIKLLYTPYLVTLENYDLSERILKFVEEGGIWIASPLTDVRTINDAKFRTSATGTLEKAANVEITFTIPQYDPEATGARGYSAFADEGKEYKARDVVYDALTPGEGVKVIAKYTDEEYLGGYAAITESNYGKGKIVMLGFVPTTETLTEIATHYGKDVGITPFVTADKNLTVVKREGEFEAIVAIEHEFCDATLVAPFNCVDMIDDHRYNEGDVINIEKYGVRVLKKS